MKSPNPKGRDSYWTKPSPAGRDESYGPWTGERLVDEATPSIEKAYGEGYGDQADDAK